MEAKYEPTKGFELSLTNNNSYIGLYKCQAGNETLLVNIVHEKTKDLRVEETTQMYGIWYNVTSASFICKINSSTIPPKLTAIMCRRPNECRIMDKVLEAVSLLSNVV